jgi:hypothetical protein
MEGGARRSRAPRSQRRTAFAILRSVLVTLEAGANCDDLPCPASPRIFSAIRVAAVPSSRGPLSIANSDYTRCRPLREEHPCGACGPNGVRINPDQTHTAWRRCAGTGRADTASHRAAGRRDTRGRKVPRHSAPNPVSTRSRGRPGRAIEEGQDGVGGGAPAAPRRRTFRRRFNGPAMIGVHLPGAGQKGTSSSATGASRVSSAAGTASAACSCASATVATRCPFLFPLSRNRIPSATTSATFRRWPSCVS